MANYKVIYRADASNGGVTWELGCPLYLSAVQVSRNTSTGECYLQLKIANVSDETISRFKLNAVITYHDNSTECLTYEPLDADLPSHQVLRPDPIALNGSDIEGVTATIVNASSSISEWISGNNSSRRPQQTTLNLSMELAKERSTEIRELNHDPDNYSRAAEDYGDWWACSCGMFNVGKGACVKCHLPKETIFNLQNEQLLSGNAKKRQHAQQENNRRSRRTAIAVSIAFLIVLAACISMAVLNASSIATADAYQAALQQKDAGNYKIAYNDFIAIEDNPAAKDQAIKCAKLAADRAYSEGNWSEAQEWYGKAGEATLQQEAESMANPSSVDTVLGEIVGRYLYADAFTESGSFKHKNFEIGRSYTLHLQANGQCSLSYNSDGKHLDNAGTWRIKDGVLFTADLPTFHGQWTATKTAHETEFVMTNDKNPDLSFVFNATEDNLYD